MREYEVIIMATAEKDLQEIFSNISLELLEPETAINLCDRLEHEILELNTMPNRHAPYKKEPWFSRGLRFFPISNFLVFYITQDSDSTVHVLRVMFSGSNVEKQL